MLLEPGRPDTLYVFDLHCWIHRFFARMGVDAARGFSRMVGKILRDRAPAYAAVCADLRWPTFRHELAPDTYKAHRPDMDEDIIETVANAKAMVKEIYDLKLYAKKGFEADDLIATLTRQALEHDLSVVIVALDKDLSQLVVQDRVVVWDGKGEECIGPAEVREKFGVEPSQLRDYLAIVGDSSDNIAGVHGAGPVAAVEILRELGSLDYALDLAKSTYLHPFFENRPRYRELLRASRKSALLAKKLVTLDDNVPISFILEDLGYES